MFTKPRVGGVVGDIGKQVSNAAKDFGRDVSGAGKDLGNQLAGIGGPGGGTGYIGPGGGETIDKANFNTADIDALRKSTAAAATARQGLSVGSDVRSQQMGLAQALQAQMAGQGPSLAQSQLKQATDRNIQQAMAMSQQRGSNPFLAQRNVAQAAASAGQQAAAQSADIRSQEQMSAQQQLAGVTSQTRGADIQTQSLMDQMAQYYTGAQGSQIETAMKSRQGLEQLMAEQERAKIAAASQIEAAKLQANAARSAGQMQAIGGLASGLGAAAIAASDENMKKNINPADEGKLKDFIDKLKAYQYEYKDEKHGEGKHSSVMAQDLEKSDLGSTAVIETPEGKMVDYGKLMAPMLAHQKVLSDKVSDLEMALKARKGKGAGNG
jgi:hypothetical protein